MVMGRTHTYDTLVGAVNDLQRRGYSDDIQPVENCLICAPKDVRMDLKDLRIDEFHRFEGETNPSDESIVYAISSAKHGVKGILISAFGPDASEAVQKLVAKLDTHPDQ